MIVDLLDALAQSLLACGRLSALALLGEPTSIAKLERARDAVLRIEQAAAVLDFAARYFQLKPALVAWSTRDRPDTRGLLANGRVAMDATRAAIAGASRDAADAIAALSAAEARTPLLAPLSLILAPIAPTLPAGAPRDDLPRRAARPPAGPVQALRGPLHVDLDPIFAPSLALLDPESQKAFDAHRGPHYWCLSIREEMASELCALSLVEHDGLPLAFYRDFAKQAWDEMRHAQFFLRLGLDLLPDFLATAPPDHPLVPGARRFRDTGAGLPVPLERNLYELTWNATLTERLILMHIDTETPGLASFAEDLRSDFCKERPAVAFDMEIAEHDETSHALLGKRWLEHLLPDKADRKAAQDRARLMRGMLMLTAFAHYHDAPLVEMVARIQSTPPS